MPKTYYYYFKKIIRSQSQSQIVLPDSYFFPKIFATLGVM